MKTDGIQTKRYDLRPLPFRRQLLLAVYAYFPPFPNTLRGFAGVKHTLLIGLTHAMPLWVYRLAIRNEAQVHRVFAWLREKEWV